MSGPLDDEDLTEIEAALRNGGYERKEEQKDALRLVAALREARAENARWRQVAFGNGPGDLDTAERDALATARAACDELRAEADALRVEHETFVAESLRLAEAVRQGHGQVVETLRARVAELNGRLDEAWADRARLAAVEAYAQRCAVMRVEPTTAGLRAALGQDRPALDDLTLIAIRAEARIDALLDAALDLEDGLLFHCQREAAEYLRDRAATIRVRVFEDAAVDTPAAEPAQPATPSDTKSDVPGRDEGCTCTLLPTMLLAIARDCPVHDQPGIAFDVPAAEPARPAETHEFDRHPGDPYGFCNALVGEGRRCGAPAEDPRHAAGEARPEDVPGSPLEECAICGDPDDHDGTPHSVATGDGRTRAMRPEGSA